MYFYDKTNTMEKCDMQNYIVATTKINIKIIDTYEKYNQHTLFLPYMFILFLEILRHISRRFVSKSDNSGDVEFRKKSRKPLFETAI